MERGGEGREKERYDSSPLYKHFNILLLLFFKLSFINTHIECVAW